LKNKLTQQAQEAQSQLSLFEQFPDLHEYRGRWRSFLCAKSVNPIAEDVGFVHSCGCCDDAVLYAMPYVERGGQRIYSDPPQIGVGEKAGYYSYGERPWDDWQLEVKKHGLTDRIVEKIEEFFKDNPVGYWDDEEDEDD